MSCGIMSSQHMAGLQLCSVNMLYKHPVCMCHLWATQISLSGCSVFVFAGMLCQFVEGPWYRSHQQCWSRQSAFGWCFQPHSCMQVTASQIDTHYWGCWNMVTLLILFTRFYFGHVWKSEVFTNASDLFNGISISIQDCIWIRMGLGISENK